MKSTSYLLYISLLTGGLVAASYASDEAMECPPTRYGVTPLVWHSPQPLVNHGIPSTLRATPRFAFDHSQLNSAAKAELDALMGRVQGLNSHYGMGNRGIVQSATVVGHTDSIGSRRYNQRLSVRRAQSTANSLVIDGVRSAAISVSGAGELQPVASNRSRAGRAANRRAEVTVNALIAP